MQPFQVAAVLLIAADSYVKILQDAPRSDAIRRGRAAVSFHKKPVCHPRNSQITLRAKMESDFSPEASVK